MKTMLFNPYSGNPRHPSDIASDPDGILMLDPDQPLRTAALEQSVHTATRLDLQEAFAAGVSYRPASVQPVKPEQKWVWLTRADIESWELPSLPTVYEFTKFVETKLKEKNNE